MKSTVVIYGHPHYADSHSNKAILNVLAQEVPEAGVVNLMELYPDYKIDVEAEPTKLRAADNIIVQGPLYWYSLPSLIMRWVEEVFTHGWAYGSTGTALAGKKVVVGITAGATTNDYHDGRFAISEHDIDVRFQATFELCGMDYKVVVFD